MNNISHVSIGTLIKNLLTIIRTIFILSSISSTSFRDVVIVEWCLRKADQLVTGEWFMILELIQQWRIDKFY